MSTSTANMFLLRADRALEEPSSANGRTGFGHEARSNGHTPVAMPDSSGASTSGDSAVAVIASPGPDVGAEFAREAGRANCREDLELGGETRLSAGERAAVHEARARAAELLESLLADRQLIEHRLTLGGRIDPMKSVRGASSLEDAITTTREMIGAYDAMLRGV